MAVAVAVRQAQVTQVPLFAVYKKKRKRRPKKDRLCFASLAAAKQNLIEVNSRTLVVALVPCPRWVPFPRWRPFCVGQTPERLATSEYLPSNSSTRPLLFAPSDGSAELLAEMGQHVVAFDFGGDARSFLEALGAKLVHPADLILNIVSTAA